MYKRPGAGILIINKKNNKYYFILLKNFNNKYDITGGKREYYEDEIDNALRETNEETYFAYNIILKDIDQTIFIDIDFYRYFIYLDENNKIKLKEYKKKLKEILKNDTCDSKELYIETLGIKRFPVKKTINNINKNKKCSQDINGKNCKLSDRIISIIKTFNDKGTFLKLKII